MHHEMFDKRQELPRLINIEKTNEVIILNRSKSFKIGKSEIRFISPNITGIFIEKSEKEMELAKKLYDVLIKPKINMRDKYKLTNHECVLFYDYIEHIQVSVIMMFSAIESLINALIPENYFYEKLFKDELKTYNKLDIQLYCGTEEKLVVIIPKAYDIKSPKGFRCWSDFKLLKKLRDDIIHSKDILPINKSGADLVERIMDFKVFKQINSGKQLIEKLKQLIPLNNKFPMLKETEELTPEYYKNIELTNLNRII